MTVSGKGCAEGNRLVLVKFFLERLWIPLGFRSTKGKESKLLLEWLCAGELSDSYNYLGFFS